MKKFVASVLIAGSLLGPALAVAGPLDWVPLSKCELARFFGIDYVQACEPATK